MRALLLAASLVAGCRAAAPAAPDAAPDAALAAFECAACHPEQVEAFARSHHALGQAEATAAALPEGEAVGFAVVHAGGAALLRWREADGGEVAGPIRYTLGVWPLVQVAVERPDGRLQVPPLGLVADAGWRAVPSVLEGPAGHWSTPSFNWNGGCAGCHASGFVVGAAAGPGPPRSRWASLALDCAACHGEEAGHRAWVAAGKPASPGAGYAARLGGRVPFAFADGGAIARAAAPPPPDVQAEACAACHARRRPLTDDGLAGGALLDRFEPALLAAGLYHPTGAVADEVYEVGSFLQSRMERAGVRCADCHQPHSGRLRAEGNALCAGCHRAEVFDRPAHHGHRVEGPGGQCLACHAPPTTFLGVDVRRDHSFRVPDPVLAARVGAPDACRGCHPALAPRALAAAVARWGGRPRPEDGVAEAFAAGFAGRLDARPRLLAVARRPEASAFERASALALAPWGSGVAEAVAEAAGSPDGWLRYGAATALAGVPEPARWRLGAPLLGDARRAVRVRAARALVGLGPVPPAVLAEAEAAERASAFRGEAWLNLAGLARAQGQVAEAEARLRTGLAVDPTFAPLRIDLADLLRASGRDAEGLALLEVDQPGPWRGPLAYARGLARWRAGDRPGALAALALAAEDGPPAHLEAWLLAVREVEGRAAGWARLDQAWRTRPGSAALQGLEEAWAAEDGLAPRAERARRRRAALEGAADPLPAAGPGR